MEDFEGGAEGGDVQYGGVAELEACRAGDGVEAWFHCEAVCLVVAPPSGEAVRILPTIRDTAVAFVDEESADTARAAVQVLVAAPRSGVDVPIMELKRHVSDGVGEVPDDEDAVGAGEGGDGWDVEELAAVVLDAREEEEGRSLRVLRDDRLDVLRREDILPRWGFKKNHSLLWLQPMMPYLRLNHKLPSSAHAHPNLDQQLT